MKSKPLKLNFFNFIMQHGLALKESFKRLWRSPCASFLTVAVIGIALAMPASLYLMVQNIQLISHDFDNGVQISLFLETGINDQQAKDIVQQIHLDKAIASVKYISPAQGLSDFQKQSGLGNVLEQLPNNPLPGVIVVHPIASLQSPAAIQSLVQRLQALPQVDIAQLDMTWVNRLYALIAFGKQAVLALAMLLGLAVLLIIGNTIRLNVQNHRTEIEVIKLMGANNNFICRPYLYTGMLYGIVGALLTYGLISLLVLILNAPVKMLANLYQIQFSLQTLSIQATAILLFLGAALGLIGSWFTVFWQLKKIEPT